MQNNETPGSTGTVSAKEWANVIAEVPEPRDEYEVGYKKPPKHGQFKKGHSGNSKGRPKRSLNMKTILGNELSERITITESGQQKRMSKQEVIIKSLTAKAIKGDTKSISIVLTLLAQTYGLDPETGEEEKLSRDDAAILDEFVKVRNGDQNE